ncbi:Na(+)/H(+) antiporter subunit B [Notoacmeibacter marinus]|uniref:Na(+)/H(+) antiporter subunit B n=1 Tax=Notoacmeibacter marinus TaxID=1876515 RepID=A0A231UU78_9HYPH|nr:Na(+)/H(+) antiporter subunit B [Notoacmeibacter marinus]OXS99469.1 Na(+)/H(+) antiporter subunit B [Notoacmeibacter marinus]
MRTVIFRTVAPFLTALMIIFSIFILLRGHNEPGGGFIGGLIAASANAVYGIACGVSPVRRSLKFHPMTIAAAGLFIATLAGMASIFAQAGFLTGLWTTVNLFGQTIDLSTTLFFDIGVYLVVLGTFSSIGLALEEREME